MDGFVTVYNGLAGLPYHLNLPLGARVTDLKNELSLQTGIDSRLQVILCDGQSPASHVLISEIISSSKAVFVYDRVLISNAVAELPEWPSDIHNLTPVPSFNLGEQLSQGFVESCARTTFENCCQRHRSLQRCVEQQGFQIEGLKMALRNLSNTMKRDKTAFDEFQDLYNRIFSQTSLLFHEFDPIMRALRGCGLHPAHAADSGWSNLAELLGEDNERIKFQAHSNARIDWEGRSRDLLRQHHEMYEQCSGVIQRGSSLAADLSHCCVASADLVDTAHAVLTALATTTSSPVSTTPSHNTDGGVRDLELDLKNIEALDSRSANLLQQCKNDQIELYRLCSRLLFEVMQLQSQVRNLDARRSAQNHVSMRLHEYSLHLKFLQKSPKLYAKCVDEVAARLVYDAKLLEEASQFSQRQTELLRNESKRRQKFDEAVLREWGVRFFPGLAQQPFRYEMNLSPRMSPLPSIDSRTHTHTHIPAHTSVSELMNDDAIGPAHSNLSDMSDTHTSSPTNPTHANNSNMLLLPTANTNNSNSNSNSSISASNNNSSEEDRNKTVRETKQQQQKGAVIVVDDRDAMVSSGDISFEHTRGSAGQAEEAAVGKLMLEKAQRELEDALQNIIELTSKNSELTQQLEVCSKELQSFEARNSLLNRQVEALRVSQSSQPGDARQSQLAHQLDTCSRELQLAHHTILILQNKTKESTQKVVAELQGKKLALDNLQAQLLTRENQLKNIQEEYGMLSKRFVQTEDALQLNQQSYEELLFASKLFCQRLFECVGALGIPSAMPMSQNELPDFSLALNLVNAIAQGLPKVNLDGGEHAASGEVVVFQLSQKASPEYRAIAVPGVVRSVLSDENMESLHALHPDMKNPPAVIIGRFIAREMFTPTSGAEQVALLTVQFVQIDDRRIG